MAVSETLLDEIRNCLDMTWELSEAERQKLSGMIARGMMALEGKIGRCNFEEDTPEKSLLIDYVRYDRSEALSDFWVNYKSTILSLQLNKWIEDHVDDALDLGSWVATVRSGAYRDYVGLSEDVDKLPSGLDSGSGAFAVDTSEAYKYHKPTDT